MKAKTYYLHPNDMHRWLNDAHDGCVKHLVIEPSAMEKVIERAAIAIVNCDRADMGLNAVRSLRHVSERASYRRLACAAYKAGGFVK